MTENEAIKEVRFNMSRIGLKESSTKRVTEAREVAIQALEEIQQYRAIGTVEEIQQKLAELDRWHTSEVNANIKNVFANTSTSICHNCDHKDEYIEELEAENAEYKSIGTIEDFKALKEMNTPYKPQEYEDRYYACKCDNILLPKWRKYPTELMPKSEGLPHCMACGQKLDWSERREQI